MRVLPSTAASTEVVHPASYDSALMLAGRSKSKKVDSKMFSCHKVSQGSNVT